MNVYDSTPEPWLRSERQTPAERGFKDGFWMKMPATYKDEEYLEGWKHGRRARSEHFNEGVFGPELKVGRGA